MASASVPAFRGAVLAAYVGASVAVHLFGVSVFLLNGPDEPEEPEPLMFEIIEPPPPPGALSDGPADPDHDPALRAPEMAQAGEPAEGGSLDTGGQKPVRKVRWRERLAKLDAEHALKQQERAAKTRVLLAELAFGEATDEVFACNERGAIGPVEERVVRKNLGRMAPMMPSGILNAAYLERVGELWRGRQKDGRLAFDLALPPELLRVRAAEPEQALVVLGRPDVRCRIRIAIGADLFPVSFYNVPVFIVDDNDAVHAAMVDAEMHIDATVKMRVRSGALPFTDLVLASARDVHRTLKGHQAIFRAFVALSKD